MKYFLITLSCLVLFGCATNQSKTYDYSAFNASRPQSILVLPPTNDSAEIDAGNRFVAWTTYPLAESGYYVLPIGLTNQYFIEQGITVAHDAHQLPLQKLHEVFGADAVLYLHITKFGSSYQLIRSVAEVEVKAKLVDAKTEQLLWENSFTATDDSSSGNGNIWGALIGAVVSHVMDSVTDRSKGLAIHSNMVLFSSNSLHYPALLDGPRLIKVQD